MAAVVARRPGGGVADPVEQGGVGALALHAPAHVEAQDVVRALPHRVHLGVAQEAGDGPLLDVAVAAVDLDGVAGGGDAEPGRPQLDQRGADAQPRPEVAVEHERLGRLHLHDQLGQLPLHQRVVGQLGAERLAGVGVAERLDQGAAGRTRGPSWRCRAGPRW